MHFATYGGALAKIQLSYFTSKFPTLKELVFTREKRFGAKRILY